MTADPSAFRVAGSEARASVSEMLARAFSQDPAFTYIFPDPVVRAAKLPRLFALLFDSDGRGGMRLVSPGREAASLWRAPMRATIGWPEMIGQALPLIGVLGGALPRSMRVAGTIEAHYPSQPFWYLHILGCDPLAQGQGWGAAAVRAGLGRASGRKPTYLETATEANVGFYSSLGFRVTAEWRVTKGGPKFWSMLRDR